MNEIDEILMNIDRDEEQGASPESAEKKPGLEPVIESIDGNIEEGAVDEGKPLDDGSRPDSLAEQSAVSSPDTGTIIKESDVPVFNLKGTKTFNMREPYVIKLDPALINYVLSELKQSFYFINEPMTVDMVRVNIKKELVKYLRRPNEHLVQNYTEFIYSKISRICDNISPSFGLDPDNSNLFIYHIGPLTIYKILRDELLHEKYGFCYKHMPANKAMRFFPDEFMKLIVLGWFEGTINILELPFDSIQKYEDIKNIALEKYHEDLKIFNTRLEQLNARVGANKSISRGKLLKVMGIRWFGIQNIEIYRRFVGATMFA